MEDPRATRIILPNRDGLPTELWMGGAHSVAGEPVHPGDLDGAWVIDCAGDMPDAHREAAALWLYRVFADLEETPAGLHRIETLARSVAACVSGALEGCEAWEHPAAPPRRLYVLCTQGLNRSGLVIGRILRGLGLAGEEVVRLLASHRPGALNNLTFARLVREG